MHGLATQLYVTAAHGTAVVMQAALFIKVSNPVLILCSWARLMYVSISCFAASSVGVQMSFILDVAMCKEHALLAPQVYERKSDFSV